jgi:hypothetical protein
VRRDRMCTPTPRAAGLRIDRPCCTLTEMSGIAERKSGAISQCRNWQRIPQCRAGKVMTRAVRLFNAMGMILLLAACDQIGPTPDEARTAVNAYLGSSDLYWAFRNACSESRYRPQGADVISVGERQSREPPLYVGPGHTKFSWWPVVVRVHLLCGEGEQHVAVEQHWWLTRVSSGWEAFHL